MITTDLTKKGHPTTEEMALIHELRHYDVTSWARVTVDENTGEEKQYVKITFKEEYLAFDMLMIALKKANWFISYLEKGAEITIMARHFNAYVGVTHRGDLSL